MPAGDRHQPKDRIHSLIETLRRSRVGIVGGGEFCCHLIHFFQHDDLSTQKPTIIGVADINPNAEGFLLARKLGIHATTDYHELYALEGLQIILEITRNTELAAAIANCMPGHVRVIDHIDARYIWDTLHVENVKLRILNEFQQKKNDPSALKALYEESFDCFSDIIGRRNQRARQIELQLLDYQRTQSQIIQGSTIPTFVIDKNHVVTHWNKALEKLSGCPADEIVGTNRQWAPFWDRERPTLADVILDQIDENEIQMLYGSQWRTSALIEGAYEAEFFFPRFEEGGKWLWFTAAPIKAPDGTIVGAIETLWDKTEDVKAAAEHARHTRENAALQAQCTASEEKYRSLFNNDPNPIFIINRESLEIFDINARTEEYYGYLRHELWGTSFLQLGDPDETEIRRGLQNLELGQSILFTKKRHFKKSGEAFYVNINVSHAEYSKGNVLIATTTDISEMVEKETQLIQAGKMTTLGLMAAGMAHEINQPLNVIQICADFFLKTLKRGTPIGDDDMRAMADDIITNVKRATGIIRHVRDFARQSEVSKIKIDINAPIEDVFKVLGHQIKTHEIELDLDLDPDIPYLLADHNRLEQVFINLVTNAIDAMDEKADLPEFEGYVKRLRVTTCTENDRVIARVTDNGVGMSSDVQSKIFEPFFTTKKVGRGTGLGVSISYGIVKDYDGVIEIESQVGRGTTFKLTFPSSGKIAEQ
jgi:PAS domain S-box-containing protein